VSVVDFCIDGGLSSPDGEENPTHSCQNIHIKENTAVILCFMDVVRGCCFCLPVWLGTSLVTVAYGGREGC
jgi:hypothetical protein